MKSKHLLFSLILSVLCGISFAQLDAESPGTEDSGTDDGIQAAGDNPPTLRFGLDFGYGYRTGAIPPGATGEAKKYFEDLKSGLAVGANFSVRIGKVYGIAFQYSRFSTAPSAPAFLYDPTTGDILATGKLHSDLSISYYGFGLSKWSFNWKNSAAFYGNTTLGYISFLDDATMVGQPFKQEGSTVGFGAQLGGDFRVSENLCLGINLAYILGAIPDMRVNGKSNQTEGSESVNRFDFSAGLRIVK